MGYTITLPSVGDGNSGFTSWANRWGDVFNNAGSVAAPTYTGSDGLINTPMDGVFRLGAHFDNSVIRMWTTQDTLIGSFYPDPPYNRTGATRFVNNVASMQASTGASPSENNYKWRGDRSSNLTTPQTQMAIIPRPSFAPDQNYWPEASTVLPGSSGNKVIFQLHKRVLGITQYGVGVSLTPIPVDVDVGDNWPYRSERDLHFMDSSNSSVENVWSSSGRHAGTAILNLAASQEPSANASEGVNGFIYAYAKESFNLYVARATEDQFGDPSNWQYWSADAGSWMGTDSTMTAIDRATPLNQTDGQLISDACDQSSVFQMPDGRLAMIYSPNGFSPSINVRYADRPEGPWSTPTTVVTISEPDSGNSEIDLPPMPSEYANWHYRTYNAMALPDLSQAPSGDVDGRLLVTYFTGTYGDPADNRSTPETFYGDMYRPRFVEFKISLTQ